MKLGGEFLLPTIYGEFMNVEENTGMNISLGQCPWFFCTPKRSTFLFTYPNGTDGMIIDLPSPKIESASFQTVQDMMRLGGLGDSFMTDHHIPLKGMSVDMETKFHSYVDDENKGSIRIINGKENLEREKNELRHIADNMSVDQLLDAIHYKLYKRKNENG